MRILFSSFLLRGFRFSIKLIRDFIQGKHISDPSQVLRFVRSLRPVPSPFRLLRIGPAGDGGYLVPDDLSGITECFSPGVGELMDFELKLAQQGIRSHLLDYSVADTPFHHPLIHFERLFLGERTSDHWITLGDWIKRVDPKGDCILQMDIEGSEFAVVKQSRVADFRKFRIMVIEFHGLAHLASTSGGIRNLRSTFRKLKRTHKVVHIHPNNCCPNILVSGTLIPPVLEVTFLRRDRFRGSTRFPVEIPNKLDALNVQNFAQVELSESWVRSRKPFIQPINKI